MLRRLKDKDLLILCASFDQAGDPVTATKTAPRFLACRHRGLGQETDELDELMAPLTQEINPALTELNGVGPDVASRLLVTAGDNPGRLRSEAAFAMLRGVAPLPTSSGRTHCHRLHRGGDRAANGGPPPDRALSPARGQRTRTRTHMERRTGGGLPKKEIIRCRKRSVAREIFHVLTATNATAAAPSRFATAAWHPSEYPPPATRTGGTAPQTRSQNGRRQQNSHRWRPERIRASDRAPVRRADQHHRRAHGSADVHQRTGHGPPHARDRP